MKAVRLYAQVLVDVAMAEKSGVDLLSVTSELQSFATALCGNQQGLKVFESPMFSEDEKTKGLKAICEKARLSPFSARFLNLLLRKARLDLLPAILSEVERLQVERRGGLVGELVSAIALDPSTMVEITEAFSKRFQKPVQLSSSVDPALIAGIRVTISGVTYDGTIRSKLARFAGM
ncbi:MAG: ATP synthase F1 subunit delta [Bdellovibrionales bacterium]|nr:ATP synthase F1 subunit delta [Bdellovibrionales bacterium]